MGSCVCACSIKVLPHIIKRINLPSITLGIHEGISMKIFIFGRVFTLICLIQSHANFYYFEAVLKFNISCLPKGLYKQCRPSSDCFFRSSLIRVFPVCSSDKHFVKSSTNNQYFICEQKEKCSKFQNYYLFSYSRLTDDIIQLLLKIAVKESCCLLEESLSPDKEQFEHLLSRIPVSLFE